MTILERESPAGRKHRWKQFFLVSDDQLIIVDMEPAVMGWNIGRITVQGHDDWCGMSEDGIVRWKLEDSLCRVSRDLDKKFEARLREIWSFKNREKRG